MSAAEHTRQHAEEKERRRRQDQERYAARVAAGLCPSCAAPRPPGDGGKTVLCPRCLEKSRRRYQDRVKPERQRRIADGVCPACGKTRDAAARAHGWQTCTPCHDRDKARHDQRRLPHRQQQPWFALRGDRPLPVGRGAAERLTGGRVLSLLIDRECQRALETMLAHDRDRQRQQAWARHLDTMPTMARDRAPFDHRRAVEPLCRVSPLVRDAIRRWADRPCPPRKKRPFWTDIAELRRRDEAWELYEIEKREDPDYGYFLEPPRSRIRFLGVTVRIGVWLDAECLRIVERDARLLYRGNKSEAVRAMIAASEWPAGL
jgi:hypothetical protein